MSDDERTVLLRSMSRSAIRAVDGELAGWHPVDLAARVMQETLERADIEPATIDEVVLGCAEPVGAQGADMARAAVLAAGWPDRVGGTVIERGETSGLTAVQLAAAVLRAGDADRVVVVGVSVASLVPPGAAAVNRVYGAPWGDAVTRRLAEQEGPLPAPRLAERGAVAAGISRAELDALAARSLQRRARAGTTAADAIGPVPAWSRGAATTSSGRMVTTDVIRTFERLADLPPAFDADGLLTAATFAPPAD
ncbi:MAG: hypothetical protein ACE5GB_09280, partial [Acidimicrobiales bacterium]